MWFNFQTIKDAPFWLKKNSYKKSVACEFLQVYITIQATAKGRRKKNVISEVAYKQRLRNNRQYSTYYYY